jgi:acyl-CoA synthetase (AMP-forming)/AMP-acid ligase II
MGEIEHYASQSALLTTGKPVTSLTPFSSPTEEYGAAFANRDFPFLHFYTFKQGSVQKRSLTRGEFWALACSAAAHLSNLGISEGNRIVHCFSANSPYDLAFRLASVLVGGAPVTINWQTDNNAGIAYKARLTEAKICIYDRGFASRVEELKASLPGVVFFEAGELEKSLLPFDKPYAPVNYDDERIVVFTSGTTARPKGASLSHRSYLTNRLTYEQYFGLSETTPVDLFLVNPLHHANSTALSDWALRRTGAVLHLLEYYTTAYWRVLAEAVEHKRGLFVASLVPRHIDFLENLAGQGKLPVAEDKLRQALKQTDILIGSAPVGPKTIERIRKFAGCVPHVRFGSTEACLQVTATPTTMPENAVLGALAAGWSHRYNNEQIAGYYIGREHFPFTRVKIVKSTDPESADYMSPCQIGEPGHLLTQGANLFSYYVGDEEATTNAFKEGWYTGLRDIAFALKNDDGNLDYYWMSRDSELLIRGGANYAYAQVAEELTRFIVDSYQLSPKAFQLAVVGIRLESEHEDSCCVTVELFNDVNGANRQQLEAHFLKGARKSVSKGAKPDHLRFAKIPRNFKGAILYPQLKRDFLDFLRDNPRLPGYPSDKPPCP